jgi:pantetheine-phosphate adenylyltransferase
MGKTVVCPGSFDPLTIGHLDIITRSAKLFDKVIVVVMKNPSKTNFCFTPEERADLIRRCIKDFPNVEVDTYEGLLADYAKKQNAIAIIKGLRAVSDFEDEFQQALINKRLNADIESLFMAADTEHMFLSSSMIKQVCLLGGDVSPFLPEEVSNEIIEKLQKG